LRVDDRATSPWQNEIFRAANSYEREIGELEKKSDDATGKFYAAVRADQVKSKRNLASSSRLAATGRFLTHGLRNVHANQACYEHCQVQLSRDGLNTGQHPAIGEVGTMSL
jgi:hypothetical protein